ncbi:helix-turn-helix transcriptional regulator [Methylobacterium symbioticum]|uniref:helix-turn-helix transcriptional regulator n=1 Tax=Methylobacterium symbioticum TaxID=2584084 RepID=UPI001158379E|nr:helix-turn-helix transcriptional regulator [Methylobacterium symbioticum]
MQGLLDLTPVEARVGRDIARGRGASEAAAQAGVTVHTIRAQLRAIYLKTGTSKQARLTALLNEMSTLRLP